MNSLIRTKNIKLFLALEEAATLKQASKDSGLTVQHALRLIKSWLTSEYIVKEGRKYTLTDKGQEIKRKLLVLQ